MSKTIQEIEKLHDSASKLSSKELIFGLAQVLLSENGVNPKAITILKTYLARALQREGIKL